ncbi:primosomal protein N' [Candidatus Peregrinibacteria bacterium]|jgi:primosomal protein N' (replication factor Y) (superfamily II helicase)|nr:primosomal protein N' [Candidatus Peregrinibacteria bacterium]MBT4147815.1 primosomal protein N' [Candidatus Peregrinibacteria bacterium]MBT4455682.1 primosomal protein N' [Candidatus Peregrinibacteria bacterium]
MYADIAFQQKIGDQETLTYEVPSSLEQTIKPGHLVVLNLRNRLTTGLVWHTHNNKPDFKTQEIEGLSNPDPLLTKTQIQLVKFISEHYFAPLFKVLKLFIPARIFKAKPMRLREKVETLPKHIALKILTKSQQEAFDTIENKDEQKNSTKTDTTTEQANKFLIHGITGSGKTEIYLHLAKKHIDNNKQVLILIPEISLTPQTVEYFESRLQIKAAVIHSRLSEGEKYKTWQDIQANKKSLVIGSRSAIFSPFKNLGLIIIDEEHEFSYKQDQSPRYLTHAVAEYMAELQPLKLVLGSATPSIETTFKYTDATVHLHQRIGIAKLPKVHIVDMREEFKKGNKSIFSDKLFNAINKTLKENKQAILFLNRRGSASSIVCRDCGDKLTCKNCDIPMTYHARTLGKPVTICHHCGQIGSIPINCPNCKSPHIRYLGIGTERIEEETKKLFKNARVLRADKDTTSRKDSFEQIYSSFKAHEADILIGTQMIGKGLHLPNVNLVGVILADIGLNIPDFRSSERSFQLLTQVAGRAGRSQEKDDLGQVVIQTYSPDHFALQATETHDYTAFYNIERQQRQLLKYPPFSSLAKLSIETPKFLDAKNRAEELEEILKQTLNKNPDLKTKVDEINTYPAFIPRLHNKYRYRILIKGSEPQALIKSLDQKSISDIKIDIDPISTN